MAVVEGFHCNVFPIVRSSLKVTFVVVVFTDILVTVLITRIIIIIMRRFI